MSAREILPADVAERAWGLSTRFRAVEGQGVNTSVWMSSDLVLRMFPDEQLDRRTRELALLSAIAPALKAAGYVVPLPFQTKRADEIWVEEGRAWELVSRIPGSPAVATNPATYEPIAKALADLHSSLREARTSLAVSETSVIPFVRKRLTTDLNGFPIDLCETGSRTLSRMQVLEQMRRQLVHGDFTHPNIIMVDAGRVIGFIDFEFCTVDPPILDLAAVALTALLRSELAEWRSIVEGVLDAYLRSSSETFTLEDLHVAMHVRKLDSCFYHRDEALGRHSSNSVFERQEDQLRQLANAIQL